ncbi:MAG TPA: HU family DNA-binding protein [Bdellovibrionota bacterium]|nr:HU family DNA-binding protein [Bdellovibrionota bacterium]
MTKAELVEKVATSLKHRELSKAAINEISDALFENLAKGVKKDRRFTYPGFGTFTVRMRKARKGRNPQTGAVINIPASKTIGFRPSPELKQTL